MIRCTCNCKFKVLGGTRLRPWAAALFRSRSQDGRVWVDGVGGRVVDTHVGGRDEDGGGFGGSGS